MFRTQPDSVSPVIYQQPKSRMILENRWKTGICDCFSDMKSCCTGFFCFPCFLCCCLDPVGKECECTNFGLALVCCSFTGIAYLRAKIRGSFQIYGSICEDCCCACLMPCCTATQIYREIKLNGED